MKKCVLKVFLPAFMMSVTLSAQATDLYTVYQQALRNDPVFAQAKATRDANKEILAQSRSALLPELDSSASVVNNRNSLEDQGATYGMNVSGGNRHVYQLTLSQPLFNFQNWMQFRAAKNTVKQADAVYEAAFQDLIMRVSRAYFSVLQSQDDLRFVRAQQKAVDDQLKQIRERYKVGMATMTDVYQAQANYDALNAQAISAQNNILNNFEALRQITGYRYIQVDGLKANFLLVHPSPADAQAWIRAGENNNWSLLGARYAAQAAKENIRVNYAGHFPVVNATEEYQNGNKPALGFGNTSGRAWNSNAGIQVALPIFQGGRVLSKTRQARDQYLAASDQMETTHRQVIFQTQQAFNNITADISKVSADRIAVTSARSALDSTEEGYKAGTKTLLDVLTAQKNLYQIQASTSTDQYGYILDTLSLKQAAGSLNVEDVKNINRALSGDIPAS